MSAALDLFVKAPESRRPTVAREASPSRAPATPATEPAGQPPYVCIYEIQKEWTAHEWFCEADAADWRSRGWTLNQMMGPPFPWLVCAPCEMRRQTEVSDVA